MSDDAELLASLRRLWTDADPVPPGLAEAVLLRLAPELDDAELLLLVESAALGEHVRGTDGPPRIRFRLDDVEVLLQLDDAANGRVRVDGWLAPGQAGTAVLRTDRAELESVVEQTGRFAFPVVPAGTATLELRLDRRRLRTPSFPIRPPAH
jgi:hypothetical protein